MSADASYFLPFQRSWIEDQSDLKLMEKSRQIGISYSTAYSAVRRAASGPHDVWVSSRDDAQAKLFVEDCRKWAELLDLAAKDLGMMVVDEGDRDAAQVIEFASGKRIYSLSSNPNALAGKRGHVILDEFALHKDQALLYRIAKPVTQWGGQLEIISTHRGAGSEFAKLIRRIVEDGNPMGFSHHKVPIQTAVEQGLVEKINAKTGKATTREAFLAKIRSECIDEEQWLQEYCCIPEDEASAFIPGDLILGCEYPTGEAWESDLWAPGPTNLYMGVDVGRTHDLTVIWMLESVGSARFTRRLVELKGQTFEAQERELYALLGLPRVVRCCIDQTGIGRQFAERAKARFGYRVEGVTFSAGVKEQLAYPVRAAFEDRSLRIPRSDAVYADLRRVRKEVTAAGNIRFAAESTADGHSDRFWALALAIHASAAAGAPSLPRAIRRGPLTLRSRSVA